MTRRTAFATLVAVATLTLSACGGAGENAPPQTVRVERASVSSGVDSGGSVSALGATNLGFATAGQLTSVRVKVGDRVEPGDVLATIDDFQARQALKQAQAGLAGQEAQYEQTKDGTQVGGAQNSLNAAASVVSATKRQVDATLRADDAAISAAKAALPQAQAGYAQAVAQLQAYQTACASGGAYPTAPAAPCQSIPAAQYAVQSAQQGVQQAQQALQQAQQKRSVDAAAGDLQIASARQGQVSAQNGLDSASAARPNSLDAAQAAVDNARAQVEIARRNLADTTLRAPAAGTVSALNGAVGEYLQPSSGTSALAPGSDATIPGAAQAAGAAAGAGAAAAASPSRPGGTQFLVLQNVAQFEVVAPFQEVDAAKIAPAQRTVISLDAIPERSFAGTVLAIAPSGTAIGGSIQYYVTMALTDSDPRVRDGQSARATVVTAQSDRLSVPNSALRREGPRTVATVQEADGRQVPTPVTTGLVGADRTEILSGLTEGQQVVIGGGAS
ncbi:efflux RND transporter periplasmic adaptor subunit [Actinomycetospora soli]|uniref:efflux RND transporter periplasmic adaptor subunit n=1 Tax=Actinomycetospora soli TaxID=2893887 RepID=UPI001E4699C1|nr:biotin/lipoyl-binding protein [Actinomycetospora soli]MCD2187461.1 biotin/lipoyl-binding protein [Actinomycetospora soli]